MPPRQAATTSTIAAIRRLIGLLDQYKPLVPYRASSMRLVSVTQASWPRMDVSLKHEAEKAQRAQVLRGEQRVNYKTCGLLQKINYFPPANLYGI